MTAASRLTSQRRLILDYLCGVKIHPSAEIVYREVRKKLPQISLGTVYRNLKKLKAGGRVLEIPGEKSRFDADLRPHAHFFCENCNGIFDVWEKTLFANPLKKKKLKIGKVKNYQIYFYGQCVKCGKK